MPPLQGINILDLTRLLPGAYCTMFLADLGADVVKIEEPIRGDYLRWVPPFIGGESAAFLALNRNKKSITLNLKKDEGRTILLKFAQTADVIVESFRPGTMERFGVGYQELKKHNEKIIYCSITGYGQTGPHRNSVGHDLNYAAMSGALTIGEHATSKPTIPGLQMGDITGGTLATTAILSALIQRQTTGQGAYLDISMLDGLLYWMAYHFSWYFATKENPNPEDLLLAGSWPFYTTYPTKDRKDIALAAIEPEFWENLCTALGRKDLANAQFDPDKRNETRIKLEATFKAKTRQEWMDLAREKDLCITPVYTLQEILSDTHMKERRMLSKVSHPTAGPIEIVENPLKVDTPQKYLPPPLLGQHTEELLKELGYTANDIERLRTAGVT